MSCKKEDLKFSKGKQELNINKTATRIDHLNYIIAYNNSLIMIDDDTYKTPQLQYDKEGYVKSFNLQEATNEQLSKFYHKYGILIFNDILDNEEVQKTIDDLWNNTISYYNQNFNKKIDRKNPKSWGQLRGFQKAFGFVGDSIIQQPQIWQNRKNPKVYQSFKRAYEAYKGKQLDQPLIACFDRGSMMLPSKLNPQWQTSDIYHFDIDPWSWTGVTSNKHCKYDYDPDRLSLLLGEGNYDPFVGYTKFAGVLALSDTNQDSGGFQCACGFQNYIHKWCKKNKLYTHIESDKNLVDNFRKIFIRKGALMIFTRELPHNIYQNKSQKFRYAQYLRMSPLSALCLTPQLIEQRKKLIKMILPKNMNVSDDISQQIFMLKNENQPQKQNKQKNENALAQKNHENKQQKNIEKSQIKQQIKKKNNK